jgi:hypothetical protein
MTRLILGVVVVAALGGTAGADPRWPDRGTRAAATGCWDVGRGATLTLAPFGKHSLQATARFKETPRGGPKRFEQLASWMPRERVFDVPCRPRSQHGSFCRVTPQAGGLRVRVYALRYDDRRTGRLVEDFVAPRCK